MAMVTDIADAVVTALKSADAGLPQPVSIARAYLPQFDLAELKTLRVTVVPKRIEIASLGRNSNQHDVSVDVAVQKKIASASADELDPLMTLVEQIANYLRLKRLALASGDSAIWVKTENAPIYAPEHLEQKQVFTSVLTVTYRVVK